MRSASALIALVMLAGCAQQKRPNDQEIASARMAAYFESRSTAHLADLNVDHYPERALWKAACETNPVTTTRTCRATANARRMDANGQPFGDSDTTIYITYLNGNGPLVSVGDRLYPGTEPTFRIDGNPPILIRGTTSSAEAVAQMRAGKILRVQYQRWPTGVPQIHLDLNSAAIAIDKLDAMRSQTGRLQ